MKILKETTDPQTLRFIPRSFVSTVDLVIKNEDTQVETTFSNLTATQVGGYLEVTEVFNLDEDTFYSYRIYEVTSDSFIRCDGETNQEFLIHNGQLLPSDSDTLDVSLSFQNFSRADDGQASILSFSDPVLAANTLFEVRAGSGASNNISITIEDPFTSQLNFDTGTLMPSSGTIRILGSAGKIDILLDGNIILTINNTYDFSTFRDVCRLNAFGLVGDATNFTNIDLLQFKAQSDTWNFNEGTGNTTTSDTAKVFTLNSNGDTEDMWQTNAVRGGDIYRGKIFCTNQTPNEYSINNGEYLERDNKKEYILRDE